MIKYLKTELEKIKKANLFRQTFDIEARDGSFIWIDGKKYVDFSSNDYLGLATHPKLKTSSIKAIEKYGTGATGSRLLSGNYDLHTKLENEIAKFKQKESALVFNSGYQANVGLFSALLDKNDVIFADKLVHASIIDGIKLSGIKFFRFKHNDIKHLETLLAKERQKFKRALVITESVFSMDGDVAKIDEIIKLKKKFDLEIMVDEAHSINIKTPKEIDYILGTFSKKFGSFGAYFACSKIVKEYLINKCRSFIFSTALPMGVISANISAIEIIENEKFWQENLIQNTKYFRNKLKNFNLLVLGETQIVPIVIGKEDKAVEVAKKLQDKGFWVLPIRYPTVAKGKARLRFSITTNHTKKILDEVLKELERCLI